MTFKGLRNIWSRTAFTWRFAINAASLYLTYLLFLSVTTRALLAAERTAFAHCTGAQITLWLARTWFVGVNEIRGVVVNAKRL